MHAGGCVHRTGRRLLGIARLENRQRRLMALPLLHQTQPSRLRRWGDFRIPRLLDYSKFLLRTPPILRAPVHKGTEKLPGPTSQVGHHCASSHIAVLDPQWQNIHTVAVDREQRAQEFM